MFGLGILRTLVGLAFLGGVVWAAFAVPLGRYTFAEHIDRIGRTPEARELIEGTRGTVAPVVEEAAGRILGERVEAPTAVAAPDIDADVAPAASPSSADETRLPGGSRGPRAR